MKMCVLGKYSFWPELEKLVVYTAQTHRCITLFGPLSCEAWSVT